MADGEAERDQDAARQQHDRRRRCRPESVSPVSASASAAIEGILAGRIAEVAEDAERHPEDRAGREHGGKSADGRRPTADRVPASHAAAVSLLGHGLASSLARARKQRRQP
jgi:hypothetical protein